MRRGEVPAKLHIRSLLIPLKKTRDAVHREVVQQTAELGRIETPGCFFVLGVESCDVVRKSNEIANRLAGWFGGEEFGNGLLERRVRRDNESWKNVTENLANSSSSFLEFNSQLESSEKVQTQETVYTG